MWVNSFDGLLDFLSLVMVCAPDNFPEEDFLSSNEQLTLDKSFEEIQVGMQFVKNKIGDGDFLIGLQNILDASLSAYRNGDDIKGARLLQCFEGELMNIK